LQKKARTTGSNYYFVIDGIQDIPQERIQKIILNEILPLGFDGFKFLFTGDLKHYNNIIPRVGNKSFPLSKFSFDETIKYINCIVNNEDDLKSIYDLSGGIPGHLSIIKRLLQTGKSPKDILNKKPLQIMDFISIEWDNISSSLDTEQKKYLACIAFGLSDFKTKTLSNILSIDENILVNFFSQIKILSISEESIISFISGSHKNLVAEKLHYLKDSTNDLIIGYLLKEKDKTINLNYLADYLNQSGKYKDYIDLIDNIHSMNLLKHNNSLAPLHKEAELGIIAAKELTNKDQLFKFSLQSSFIIEIEQTEIWKNEIEARMSLDDFNSAIMLAQNAVLKENKLYLLATIIKIKYEQTDSIDKDLLSQIRLLIKQIDPSVLGDKAIDIASELICVDPDLAINLIKISTNKNSQSDTLDLSFAKLSFAAQTNNKLSPKLSEIIEKTSSNIKDPKLQILYEITSSLLGNYPPQKIIDVTNKLEFDNKLFFLR
jgi:hypothetical protein